MWDRMRKQPFSDSTLAETETSSPFTDQQRVDLIHLLRELFPPDGDEKEIYALEEVLIKKLHRLSLGPDNEDTWERIKNFILTASEDGLLTLIEAMPEAQSLAVSNPRKYGKKIHYWAFGPTSGEFARAAEEASQRQYRLPKTLEILRSRLNEFVERTFSPARFLSDGTFQREAFAIEVSSTLSNLPGKETLISDAARLLNENQTLALLFIDLDDFKSVNTQLGHPGGTTCLEKAVGIIGNAVARKGKLYRYGGDEFAVVLPNFESAEAAVTGERIRKAIEEKNPGGSVRVTASIGVVSSSQLQTPSAETLIEAADQAMYSSKNSGNPGKNRVTVWEPSLRPPGPQDSIQKQA